MENKNEDLIKGLEFLAVKSKELLEKQISSYRQKHTNASTIIAVIALFIPFFIGGLEEANKIFVIISIIPIIIFLSSVIIMLYVIRSKPLDQGINPNKYECLANDGYRNILITEISANKCSFEDNQSKTEKINNCYNLGIKLTILGITLSVIVLFLINFEVCKSNDKIQKVEIINYKNLNIMAKDDNKSQTPTNSGNNNSSGDKNQAPKIKLKNIPPEDRIQLNEGKIDMEKNIPDKLDNKRK